MAPHVRPLGVFQADQFVPHDTTLRPSSIGSGNVFSGDLLRMHPSRELPQILSLLPDVTYLNGGLHVRGSRDKETGYRFNGIDVWNRYYGDMDVPFIPEAIEEMTVHTGAYGADLGSANGGIVDIRMRQGGETFAFDAKYITDDVQRPGSQILGTSSYGFNTVVATLGGPLPFGSNFFVAAEAKRMRDSKPMYVEPMRAEVRRETVNSAYVPLGAPASYPDLSLDRNHVPGMEAEQTTIQWNVGIRSLGIRLFGSYSANERPAGHFDDVVTGYLRVQSLPRWRERSLMLGGSFAKVLSDRVRMEATVSYRDRSGTTWDPLLGDDWRAYADSLSYDTKQDGGWTSRYYRDYQRRYFNAQNWFRFDDPYTINNSFLKERQTSFDVGASIELTASSAWKASFGGEISNATMRKLYVSDISRVNLTFDPDQNGIDELSTYGNEYDRRIEVKRFGQLVSYGYDVFGNMTDDGYDQPRRPVFGSFYIDNTIAVEGGRVQFGLTGVSYGLDHTLVRATLNPLTGEYDLQDVAFDYNRSIIDEDNLDRSSSKTYVLPSLSAHYTIGAWSLTGGIRWHAQPPALKGLYLDNIQLSDLVSPYRHYVYYTPALDPYWPVASSVDPSAVNAEMSRHIHMDVTYEPIRNVTLEVGGYLKDMKNQLRLGATYSSTGYPLFTSFVHTGESRSIGAFMSFRVGDRAFSNASLTYAFNNSRGQGSERTSNADEIREYRWESALHLLFPLAFQQEHRILLEGRYRPNADHALWGLDVRCWGRIESGHPYTRSLEGSAGYTAWAPTLVQLVHLSSYNWAETRMASRTPWTITFDASLRYGIDVDYSQISIFLHIQNIFDRKNEMDVYPTTGSANYDGWLQSRNAQHLLGAYVGYAGLYRSLVLTNRWASFNLFDRDMISPPRQVRIGVEVGI